MKKPPPTPSSLDRGQARRILAQMGENGKPPEVGISQINVGNETYLKVLDATYIKDTIKAVEGSSFKLVQGTYGAGKTHFLYCVRDLAWRRDLLTAYITISPKETPFNKPLAIYRAVAQRLELPRGPDGDETRGLDDIIRRRIEMMKEEKEDVRKWTDTLARAPITRHSFRDAVVGFARAILDGDDRTAQRLAAWLRGEDVSLVEAKSVGIYEVPANDNGFGMVRSLCQLVPRLGFEGTVLLLDEAERRLSIDVKPTKAVAETVDHLRELVDLCGRSELPRTLIFYAVTPAFTQQILPLYPALQQRLGSPIQFVSAENPKAPVIDLEALDLEPKKLLVKLGARLEQIACRAYDWEPNQAMVDANLDRMVSVVTEEQLEVGHRRFFVKLWVRLLDQMRLGKPKIFTVDDMRDLVRDEQAIQVEEHEERDPQSFFGTKVDPLKPRRR
jgi:hypothetical protein